MTASQLRIVFLIMFSSLSFVDVTRADREITGGMCQGDDVGVKKWRADPGARSSALTQISVQSMLLIGLG
jgi:hypothetical protein